MHTGGAFHTDADASDYGGQGVHTAARIGAAAAKREILVSRETLDGIGTAFRALGASRRGAQGVRPAGRSRRGPLALIFRERPAEGEPAGLLVLHHGRGADENDLLPLADALDRERRLHVVTPRAPLELPGWPGYHWYVVPRVGYPDPETFHRAFDALAAFHDDVWERTGVSPARTVLGGFSMGSVMSYSLGLA